MNNSDKFLYLLITKALRDSTFILVRESGMASIETGPLSIDLMLKAPLVDGEHPCETCYNLARQSTHTDKFTSFYKLSESKIAAIPRIEVMYLTEQEDTNSDYTCDGFVWVELEAFIHNWPLFAPCFS